MEAFQTTGVLLGVVGAGDDLRGWGGDEVASARLGLCSPRRPEASFFDGRVSLELDDHEVGGRDERLFGQVESAGKGGNVDGGVFSSTAAENLDGVKVFLGVEFGELKKKRSIWRNLP